MPLRDLFYITRQYEQLTAGKDLYGKIKIKRPAPRFIVFYNGKAEQPEKREIKLSEAYFVKEEQPNLRDFRMHEYRLLMTNDESNFSKSGQLYLVFLKKGRSFGRFARKIWMDRPGF